MCQQFHQLPNEGGLLDQDQLYVRKMLIVLEQQEIRREKDEKEREMKSRLSRSRAGRRP